MISINSILIFLQLSEGKESGTMQLADVPNRNGIVTVSGETTADHKGTTVNYKETKEGHLINKRITEVMENGTSEPSSLQSSRYVSTLYIH